MSYIKSRHKCKLIANQVYNNFTPFFCLYRKPSSTSSSLLLSSTHNETRKVTISFQRYLKCHKRSLLQFIIYLPSRLHKDLYPGGLVFWRSQIGWFLPNSLSYYFPSQAVTVWLSCSSPSLLNSLHLCLTSHLSPHGQINLLGGGLKAKMTLVSCKLQYLWDRLPNYS